MAPELRKKKSKSAAEGEAAPKAKVAGTKKRKATEDAPAIRESKRLIKKTPKDKSAKKQKPTPAEDAPAVREDTPEDAAQQLAAEVDNTSDNEQPESTSAFTPGDDVGTIPPLSKKGARKAAAASARSNEQPGVVYVGRIPHGFYEHEMRQYFSQFGPITRLRLSRNKHTGASKHFAFVEFAEASTAEVVAKTMDNYLLFGHVLKCKVVPPERVHARLWEGANRRFKKVPWNMLAAVQLSRPKTEAGWERRMSKERKRRAARAEKLKGLGYEFEAPSLKAVPAPPPRAEVQVVEGEAPAGEIEAGETEKGAMVEAGA